MIEPEYSLLSLMLGDGKVHATVKQTVKGDMQNPVRTFLKNLDESDVARALIDIGMRKFREQYVI